ncbi:hypothetical protein H2248_003635 [Termitomyces sp. 'cryptogamus']|nr:hypothetical protein H2248_003635 [Termitomyces sp. 'cryptogamus']
MRRCFLTVFFLLYAASAALLQNTLNQTSLTEVTNATLNANERKLRSTYLVKRLPPNLIQEAVDMYLEKHCKFVGRGAYGEVYLLRMLMEQPVILKVIKIPQNPHGGYDEKIIDKRTTMVRKEVQHLRAVDQFLGWGHNHSGTTHYILIRYMGDSLQTVMKIDPRHFTDDRVVWEMQDDAILRYIRKYPGILHRDSHPENFVYHRVAAGKSPVDGRMHWQAELIDWGLAIHTGEGTIPAVSQPQIISENIRVT